MSDNFKPHKQVITKVNAYVDEGVKELVEALNGIENVITWDSCERGEDGMAVVCLHYGQLGTTDIASLAKFADALVRVLGDSQCLQTQIRIEWAGVDLIPHIALSLPAHEVPLASSAICNGQELLTNRACRRLPDEEHSDSLGESKVVAI